jgi:hypothetical protein
MTPRAKTTVLAFTLVTLLAAPFSEAARLGKSRSSGMMRSAPTPSYQAPAPRPLPSAPMPAPAKKGPGLGTAIAAGAAGAAAGYMLGSAMHNNNAPAAAPASAPASQPAGSDMPWGTIALLGLLLVGGLMLFRRKAGNPVSRVPQTAGMPNGMDQEPARFEPIPKIGSGFGTTPSYGAPMATTSLARLPDGTETPHFLRQAKATFLHLQSLNTPDSLEEIRKYLTPDLFEALRADIAGNDDVADFPQLDCQLIEAVEESSRYIASVRFSGSVSETVNAAAVPFGETWHYVKDKSGSRWLLAGIQQD